LIEGEVTLYADLRMNEKKIGTRQNEFGGKRKVKGRSRVGEGSRENEDPRDKTRRVHNN